MSQLNTIRITDDDFDSQNYNFSKRSAFPQPNFNPRVNYQPDTVYDDASDQDYTQYTANSALEDSFELDSQA